MHHPVLVGHQTNSGIQNLCRAHLQVAHQTHVRDPVNSERSRDPLSRVVARSSPPVLVLRDVSPPSESR